MPTRDYMVIDARHDHSFRVPRPDLSVKLGTPNACGACHAEKGAKWAQAAVERWYGPARSRSPHYAEALKAGRDRAPDAAAQLLRTITDASVPGIARATAAAALPDVAPSPRAEETLRQLPADADPLVRLAAARSVALAAPRERIATFGPLLHDANLAVRLEAVSQLARVPREAFTPAALASLQRVAAEYRAAQLFNAERSESWLNLGVLETQLGNAEAALRAYGRALELEPTFIAARINLADLYRGLGRDADAEKALREAVRIAPGNADAHHALGLTLVRQGKREAALPELSRAARLAPQSPRYAYVEAVALHDAGQQARAIQALEAARRRFPGDRDIAEALAAYTRRK
jgi:tetratricopeptide (TPR) repeat protein